MKRLREGAASGHLLALTYDLPCRKIAVNDEPYLERYFIALNSDGSQVWLHRFLTPDGDRHFHTHPWHEFEEAKS